MRHYVENSHPAILDKDMCEAVQLEMERRREFAKKYQFKKLEFATDNNLLAGRALCGCCGRAYGRKL